MKTLIFGAGPLGSLYASLLWEGGHDVRLLARGKRYDFLSSKGVVLREEYSGATRTIAVPITRSLEPDDEYDLIIVLVRKNKLGPIFQVLKKNRSNASILFMGNNALGFDDYIHALPKERILFGFPGAGGSVMEQVVHYVDGEKPGGRRMPIRLGEMDGIEQQRTRDIVNLFESSGVPVETVPDMDGWLKYHLAFVLPLGCALYKHDCDNRALADDAETIHAYLEACREAGNVLAALGFTKRQPFKFNLFYWFPDFITVGIFEKMFRSRYAEIAFTMHARAAKDEMRELLAEFDVLRSRTSVSTPSFDRLRAAGIRH